jgi:hypothetical protein
LHEESNPVASVVGVLFIFSLATVKIIKEINYGTESLEFLGFLVGSIPTIDSLTSFLAKIKFPTFTNLIMLT